MKHNAIRCISTLTIVLAISPICGDAMAGEFKTLNTAGLAVNGLLSAYSSPKNTASPAGTIEMEAYEWVTASAGGTYQCNITKNATGQALSIALVGLNATIINSCSAPVNGTCNTPPVGLVGNGKFQCLVATQCCGKPVSSAAYYIMAVQRKAPSSTSLDTTPSESGVTGGQ